MVNIPLSDKCIEILIQKLDVDGDGEIDFGQVPHFTDIISSKSSLFFINF